MGDLRRNVKNDCGDTRYGFTMVELSLSIAFISILSITIVLIITNAVSAYHRGLTLNAINSTGMDLIDDFRATIQNSLYTPVADLCARAYSGGGVNDKAKKEECLANNAEGLISRVQFGDVQLNEDSLSGAPLYGAFCTGRYSYIWNSGYFFSSDASVALPSVSLVLIGNNSSDVLEFENFKLLKVRDEGRAVCANWENNNAELTMNNGSSFESDPPVDLLEAGANLAIYDLMAPIPADNGNNGLFYSMSFILGTVQGGINVMASGDYCSTPGGYNAAVENIDYCAINKFNFAIQATGG